MFSQILPFVSLFIPTATSLTQRPFSCCSSFLTSSLSPLPLLQFWSGQRTEPGGPRTSHGHTGEEAEQTSRKVTLISERETRRSHVTESTGRFRKGTVNKATYQRQKQTGTEKCLWVWRPEAVAWERQVLNENPGAWDRLSPAQEKAWQKRPLLPNVGLERKGWTVGSRNHRI